MAEYLTLPSLPSSEPMMTLELVYWTCIAIGVLLILVSLVFGEIFGFGIESGDFGFLSGPVIASFLILFGGGGILLLEVFKVGGPLSAAGAFASGFGGSGVVYYITWKLILSQQGGTEYDPKKSVGTEAEVITRIPEKGTGEITFDHTSGRISGPARSLSGVAIERGNVVVVEKFVAGVYIVRNADHNPPIK